jgi:hypothetical protein
MSRPNYHSVSWRLHRHVSFTFWGAVVLYVGYRQVLGAVHHTWPVHSAFVICACLVILMHPPLQGHHWLTYRHFRGLLWPLNIPLYVVGVMPVSPAVNWAEAKLRHLFGFRSEWPGTLIALPAVGLLPLWIALAIAGLR